MKTEFSERYNVLEQDVLKALKNKIVDGNVFSAHNKKIKCAKINIFGYTEIILNRSNVLELLDDTGMRYSLMNSDLSLTDLIDILNELTHHEYYIIIEGSGKKEEIINELKKVILTLESDEVEGELELSNILTKIEKIE